MIIGILSDSHDHVPNIKKAVDLFKEQDAETVLHAGDYCSPFTIPPFEGLDLIGILGNNDGDLLTLRQKFDDIDAELHGSFLEITIGGVHFAMYHGTEPAITDALHHCGKYDVVVSGHTHEQVNVKVGNTLALNPGTTHGFEDEASVAIYNTQTRKPHFFTL